AAERTNYEESLRFTSCALSEGIQVERCDPSKLLVIVTALCETCGGTHSATGHRHRQAALGALRLVNRVLFLCEASRDRRRKRYARSS
ncbi:hypothetical protein KUCAC02_004711, partial [Chaenocephalus aceratus]